MAATPRRLFTPAQLTASPETYYASPASVRTILQKITFTNSTGISVNLTAYLVPSSGAADATNIVYDAFPIAAHTVLDATALEGHVMEPGDVLVAFDSAGASTDILGSGVQIGIS